MIKNALRNSKLKFIIFIVIFYVKVFQTHSRYRGYYMAAWRYEISLRVLKNISRVSQQGSSEIFFNMRRVISYLQAVR